MNKISLMNVIAPKGLAVFDQNYQCQEKAENLF